MPAVRIIASVLKVGNSKVIVLPKTICDTYGIEKGAKLSLIMGDEGVFIPVKAKQIPELKNLKDMKEFR